MNKSIRYGLITLMSLLFSFGAEAQTDVASFAKQTSTDTPLDFFGDGLIRQSNALGIGGLNEYDTYLSPQEYTGTSLTYRNESYRNRSWQGGDKWITNKVFQAYVGFTENKVRNSNAYSFLMTYHYGYLHRWRINDRLQLFGGGGYYFNAGTLYNTRNGNNPSQIRLSFGLLAQGMAIWNFKIGHHPLRFSYEVGVPLMGAVFTPNYGQSYYELYEHGESSGLLKGTTPSNAPSILNLFSLDMPAWKHVTLRISYLADVHQAKVNYLRSHSYNNAFMIGFVWDSITLPSFHRRHK